MVKKLLITTSLEETWGKENIPRLLLGEWCKIYNKKKECSESSMFIMPYHWDNRGKIYQDYNYLKELYEKLLIEITFHLNDIHNVKHTTQYWRILIGPWLGYFTQIVFDRWASIEQAINFGDNLETIVLAYDDSKLIPNDMHDFTKLYLSDEWNHYIYSKIIRSYTCIKIHESNTFSNSIYFRENKLKKTLKSRIKERLNLIYSNIVNLITKSNGVLFIATYQSLKEQIKLYFKFSQLPIFNLNKNPVLTAPDLCIRKWSISSDMDGFAGFDKFIRFFIPLQIPIVYLEGYSALNKQSFDMPWPKNPKVIFTSNAINSDDIFKLYAASKIENGTPLIVGQHGGHYGSGKWSFTEEHEIAVSNKFFSWGWTEKIQPNVQAIGQIKTIKESYSNKKIKSKLLLVTMCQPRFSYFMYSVIVARQWLDYFNDQCHFINGLTNNVRDELIVRLYPNDYGWNQKQRWLDAFPELTLDLGDVSVYEQINKSRIFISTYNATTFLETFAMNVPTVMYWNEENWELRDSAIPYYEELKNAGIFHSSPESAACHVNKIWDNVDAWWSSEIVRVALKKFSDRFCDNSGDVTKKLEVAIKDLIAKNQNEKDSKYRNEPKK